MPYFVYRIHPGRKLELMEQFDNFKDAKNMARSARAGQAGDDETAIKVMFARDTAEAETLLTQHREPPIVMEHEK